MSERHTNAAGADGNWRGWQAAESFAVPALLILAAAARIHHLNNPSLTSNELLLQCPSVRCLGNLLNELTTIQHGAVPFLVQWLWINVCENWTHWRLLPALFGVLAVAAAYACGREAHGVRGAFLFALFIALSPLSVAHSQEFRMYSMLQLFVLLSSLHCLRIIAGRRDRLTLLLWTLTAVLTCASHHLGYIAVMAQIATIALASRSWKQFRPIAVPCAAIAAGILLAVVPSLLNFRTELAMKSRTVSTASLVFLKFLSVPAAYRAWPHLRNPGLWQHGFLIAASLAIWTTAARHLAGRIGNRPPDTAPARWLPPAIALPTLLVLLALTFVTPQNFFEPFYFLVPHTFILFSVAGGISGATGFGRRIAVTGIVLGLEILGLHHHYHETRFSGVDNRAMARITRSITSEAPAVFVPPFSRAAPLRYDPGLESATFKLDSWNDARTPLGVPFDQWWQVSVDDKLNMLDPDDRFVRRVAAGFDATKHIVMDHASFLRWTRRDSGNRESNGALERALESRGLVSNAIVRGVDVVPFTSDRSITVSLRHRPLGDLPRAWRLTFVAADGSSAVGSFVGRPGHFTISIDGGPGRRVAGHLENREIEDKAHFSLASGLERHFDATVVLKRIELYLDIEGRRHLVDDAATAAPVGTDAWFENFYH